jgi:hypothetical protein
MHPVLKHIIETAIERELPPDKAAIRDAAIDEMYVKLIVRPIQRRWIHATAFDYHCSRCYYRGKQRCMKI